MSNREETSKRVVVNEFLAHRGTVQVLFLKNSTIIINNDLPDGLVSFTPIGEATVYTIDGATLDKCSAPESQA